MDEKQTEKAITWLALICEEAEWNGVSRQWKFTISDNAMSALRLFVDEIVAKKEQ